jgi:DNA-binding transcriptional regulator YiaG
MAKSLNQIMGKLPAARRKKVEQRGAELIQEEMTLMQLRKDLNLTQEQMANLLEKKQAEVSKFEKRGDMLVSTLRSYIRALGGELELIARLPGRDPIKLGELER